MAFVVEDGTGLSSANSLASVQFADDYLAIDPSNDHWKTLTSESKEFLLIRATEVIELMATWKGDRVHSDSGTSFPREELPKIDGVSQPDDAVPTPVARAVALMAASLYTTDPFEERETAGFESIEVDVISLEVDKSYKRAPLPAMVRLLLSDYASVPSPKGPSFGRVVK